MSKPVDNNRTPASGGDESPEALKQRIRELEAQLAATEQENAETAALLHAFQGAFESTDEGLALYDANQNLVFFNKAYATLYPNLSKYIKLGMSHLDVIKFASQAGSFVEGVENPAKYVKTRKKEIANKSREFFRHPMTDGRTMEFGDFNTADGGMLCLRRDVTARVEHETALESARFESAQFLEGFAEHSPNVIYLKDPRGRYTFVNKAYEKMSGVGRDFAIGRSTTEVLGAEIGKVAEKNDADVLKTGKTIKRLNEARVSSGKIYHFEILKFPIRDPKGKIIGIAGVQYDRTPEIIAERQIEESRAQFIDYAESTSDWFWEQDADLKLLRVSGRNVPPVLRNSKKYFNKTRWDAFGADPDKDKKWGQHRDDLLARKPFRDFRFEIPNPKGKPYHLSVSGKPVFDENGTFCGYRGSATNITDQVFAAERAAEGDQLLRDAIDSISEGFALYDSDDKLVYCNDTYVRLHPNMGDIIAPGMKFDVLIKTSVKRKTIPSAIGREKQFIKDRLEHHKNPQGPIERKLEDGTIFLINESRTSNGGWAITLTDITEQRMVQEEAAVAHERLLEAMEALPASFMLFDRDEKLVIHNERTKELMPWHADILKPGVSFERIVRNSSAKNANTHGFKRKSDWNKKRMEEFRNPGAPMEINRADGSTVIAIGRNTASGETVQFIMDITELKNAEQRAEEAQRQLIEMIDAMPASVMLYDAEDKLVLFNEKTREILHWHGDTLREGVAQEDLVRNSIKLGMHKNAIGREEEYIQERLKRHRSPRAPDRAAARRRKLGLGPRTQNARWRHPGRSRRYHRTESCRAASCGSRTPSYRRHRESTCRFCIVRQGRKIDSRQ